MSLRLNRTWQALWPPLATLALPMLLVALPVVAR